MKKLFLLIAFFSLALYSCRKDVPVAKQGIQLGFSTDSVLLDTVFTAIGSSTYRLKVFNPSSDKVIIDNIRLKDKVHCISLNINGIPSNDLDNVEILGKDSIHIFIEIKDRQECDKTPNDKDPSGSSFWHLDYIVFTNKDVVQEVKLKTLIQDAYFHFPDKFVMVGGSPIPYSIIENDTTLPNDKPHVIYGYVVVDENATLNILGQTELYFHKGAGLWIYEGATLKVAENSISGIGDSVIFAGDRLEPYYEDIPGQWGGVLGGLFIQGNSGNHIINNTVIKNATTALRLDSNVNSLTTLSNSWILNSSRVGIYGGFGNLKAENVVVANAGVHLLYAFGGSYDFTNCTFANYWQGSTRSSGGVALSNYLELVDDNNTPYRLVRDLNQANFSNCIIVGNNQEELSILEDNSGILEYFLQYNMIDIFDDVDDRTYDITDQTHFQSNLFNNDPGFVNTSENVYALDTNSQATDQGTVVQQTPLDILGYPRDGQPDLGAYERKF